MKSSYIMFIFIDFETMENYCLVNYLHVINSIIHYYLKLFLSFGAYLMLSLTGCLVVYQFLSLNGWTMKASSPFICQIFLEPKIYPLVELLPCGR